MSPITFTQQGIITQCELAKILIITSDGLLEVAFPLTDDDRRDMEIHIRGKFARNLAVQVKSTLHLAHRFKAYQLVMAFANPVFVVPSAEVHSHAAPRLDVPFRVQTHEVGRRVLDIFGEEKVSRDASPLPAELAGLDGIVLVGQRP
jgi:hypothetical protein